LFGVKIMRLDLTVPVHVVVLRHLGSIT